MRVPKPPHRMNTGTLASLFMSGPDGKSARRASPAPTTTRRVRAVRAGAVENKGGTGHWPVPSGDPPDGTGEALCLPAETVSHVRPAPLSRNDSVKKNFNHRWTQINTDEEMSERRSGPDFRRSLNDALYVVLEYHVFHLCPSVSICVHLCPSVVKKSFTAWIRLSRAGSPAGRASGPGHPCMTIAPG